MPVQDILLAEAASGFDLRMIARLSACCSRILGKKLGCKRQQRGENIAGPACQNAKIRILFASPRRVWQETGLLVPQMRGA